MRSAPEQVYVRRMAKFCPMVEDINAVWHCLFCRAHVRLEEDPQDLAKHAHRHEAWCLWRQAWDLAQYRNIFQKVLDTHPHKRIIE